MQYDCCRNSSNTCNMIAAKNRSNIYNIIAAESIRNLWHFLTLNKCQYIGIGFLVMPMPRISSGV